MRRYRGIIIAAVICVALAGAYFYITSGQDAATTGFFWVPQQGETVSSVELENEFGSFLFRLEDDGRWIVEAGGEYRTNAEKMHLFTTALNYFPIKRVLENELPEYGFAEPRARVNFTTNRGRTFAFEVGGTTPGMGDVYIRDLNSGQIMLAGLGSVAQLTGSLTAYRDKEVLTVDGANIMSIALFENDNLSIAAERAQGEGWRLTEPFIAPARQILLNELITDIRQWRIAGYPDHKDYTAMGLDQPKWRLELRDGAGTVQRLEIGGAASGTMTYVRTGGLDEIAILFSVDLDFSALTPETLMFIAPLSTTIDQVQSISIKTPDGESVFTIDHSQNEERIFANEKEYSLMEFSSVFVGYIGISAVGRESATQPAAEPEAVLTTWFVDGNVTELHLLPRDAYSFYMDWGEDTGYYIHRSALDELISRVRNLP